MSLHASRDTQASPYLFPQTVMSPEIVDFVEGHTLVAHCVNCRRSDEVAAGHCVPPFAASDTTFFTCVLYATSVPVVQVAVSPVLLIQGVSESDLVQSERTQSRGALGSKPEHVPVSLAVQLEAEEDEEEEEDVATPVTPELVPELVLELKPEHVPVSEAVHATPVKLEHVPVSVAVHSPPPMGLNVEVAVLFAGRVAT